MEETRRDIVDKLAKTFKRTHTAVQAVIDSQDLAIVSTITNDSPLLNVKLDYLGRFETLPYRRQKIAEAVERNNQEVNQ